MAFKTNYSLTQSKGLVMPSEFGKLNFRDLGKGFIVAIFAAFLGAVLPLLESGTLPDLAALKLAGLMGIAAGFAYIGKNLLTNSDGQTFKTEPK